MTGTRNNPSTPADAASSSSSDSASSSIKNYKKRHQLPTNKKRTASTAPAPATKKAKAKAKAPAPAPVPVETPPPLPPVVKTEEDAKKAMADINSEANKKRRANRNFTEEEDYFIAKSYVMHSEDAVNGSNKKGKNLWKEIKATFDKMIKEDCDCYHEDMLTRSPDTLQNRWQRHIQNPMTKFNAIYRKVYEEDHSGWGMNDYYEESRHRYTIFHKSGCKLPKRVWEYLSQNYPKFDPLVDPEVADSDASLSKQKQNLANKMTERGQAAGKDRPMGTKKSKDKMIKESKSQAAALKVASKMDDAIESNKLIADQIKAFNKQQERKTEYKKLMERAKLHQMMGETIEAQKCMKQAFDYDEACKQQDAAEAAVAEAAKAVVTDKANSPSSLSGEEESSSRSSKEKSVAESIDDLHSRMMKLAPEAAPGDEEEEGDDGSNKTPEYVTGDGCAPDSAAKTSV